MSKSKSAKKKSAAVNKPKAVPVADVKSIIPVHDEHLSIERLKSLAQKESPDTVIDSARPKSSFIDLMNWVFTNFAHKLTDRVNLNKFIHSNIVIDGLFMHYASTHGITITPLHKDSIVSFETEEGFERFFVQGVFLVKSKKTEFICSALLLESPAPDDELKIFVIVSEANFSEYRNLRNDYEAWAQERFHGNRLPSEQLSSGHINLDRYTKNDETA